MFCDVGAVASTGFVGTDALLFAVGFVERRLRALAWAAILVVSALVADFLWQIGWEPFDRSGDYEAVPQTPFVLIGREPADDRPQVSDRRLWSAEFIFCDEHRYLVELARGRHRR